ncbi:MAG: acetyl-CoA carboxylase biotin carboxyl carrier protein [Caldisericia bacterium]|nr:acetyl-CoA carboxylase biotin carboxyl carrier protein [Caldisericia bacterium]
MRENQTKTVNIESDGLKISIEQKENLLSSKENIIAQSQLIIETEKEQTITESDNHMISTPLVGTFYRSSSPQSDLYVELNDEIEKGQVLCIVEAMKVMNEIHSDTSGKIVNIFVENGEMVEYGQLLFEIEPKETIDEA